MLTKPLPGPLILDIFKNVHDVRHGNHSDTLTIDLGLHLLQLLLFTFQLGTSAVHLIPDCIVVPPRRRYDRRHPSDAPPLNRISPAGPIHKLADACRALC